MSGLSNFRVTIFYGYGARSNVVLYNRRAPFVFMKKYTKFLFASLPAVGLVVYVLVVAPSIGNPITLSVFFALLTIFFVSLMYFLLGPMKRRRRRAVWSGITGLFLTYLVALGSLNALNSPNLVVAIFVLGAMIFLVDRSKL